MLCALSYWTQEQESTDWDHEKIYTMESYREGGRKRGIGVVFSHTGRRRRRGCRKQVPRTSEWGVLLTWYGGHLGCCSLTQKGYSPQKTQASKSTIQLLSTQLLFMFQLASTWVQCFIFGCIIRITMHVTKWALHLHSLTSWGDYTDCDVP